MTDMFTPEERSRIMARIHSRGNSATELRFVRLLRRFQIKGWRRGSKLPGRPDFVFHRHRVAVFIDGDFWHGNPRCFRVPKSNVEYWTSKILGNRRRDRAVNRTLAARGWRVVRLWQSSLQDSGKVVAKLAGILAEQGGSPHVVPHAALKELCGADSQPQLQVAEPKAPDYGPRRTGGRCSVFGRPRKAPRQHPGATGESGRLLPG